MQVIGILIPMALPGPYDYLVPKGIDLKAGTIVRVPLGRREVDGVVWGPAEGKAPPEKLKSIISVYDVKPLSESLRKFVDWMASYVMAPPGLVLRLVMRAPEAFEPAQPVMGWRANSQRPLRETSARKKLYDVLADGAVFTTADLAREAGVSQSVVRALAKDGYLDACTIAQAQAFAQPVAEFEPVTLSADQKKVTDLLRGSVSAQKFQAHLLDGVTGSGKTEVFFEAVAQAISEGKQALILLPEISLTGQLLDRFEKRFGCQPAVWHSALGVSDRRRTWRGISDGEVSVLVGARSALFLPWDNLGVIIVDEEHDGGFKQDEGVIYNARDMAVVRARYADCPVILSSATPSLESVVNAQEQRYIHHRLASRFGQAQLPDIDVVDMRHTPPPKGYWMVDAMTAGIEKALADKKQALIFLNRRGYAPLTLCRQCGHRYACHQCDAWMVEHRFRNELMCHHCGIVEPIPAQCVSCGGVGTLTACGPGIERVTEEVVERFPDARIAVLSSDFRGGMNALRDTMAQIADGKADIIVGTQIVAKGHHFPNLSFVGVVDADLGLGNGDLRAAERTYQLLLQVAGRAGRDATRGRALLQSYMPDHPVLEALISGDRDAFLAAECAAREAAHMPPYGRLAALIVSAPSQEMVIHITRDLAKKIPIHNEIQVLGPAPAPIMRVRNRYRYRFLIKASRQSPVQGFIHQWLAQIKLPNNARLSIDIDPYSFM
ncbi:primosomal protein N' [Alphaproteobacteria bacterium]|nr:primosomal protein N' [Alphaproteobacteria bacterium]